MKRILKSIEYLIKYGTAQPLYLKHRKYVNVREKDLSYHRMDGINCSNCAANSTNNGRCTYCGTVENPKPEPRPLDDLTKK